MQQFIPQDIHHTLYEILIMILVVTNEDNGQNKPRQV